MAGKPNQDPGQTPGTADELLADLMHAGEILDLHHEQGEALNAAKDGIAERRAQIEAEREEAERALVDDHNAKAGKLGMQAEDLKDEERRLKQRRGRHQRKVGRLGGQLRELAADPDAERSTIVAYAAFIATQPDFTAAAVDRMGELDEAVRSAAGQPFALVQGSNFAFGKIEEETEGLIVDTGEDVHRMDAIRLPVARTNPVKHARRKPYYGYFSAGFDHSRDMYEAYDSVVGRNARREDVMNPDAAWSTMSHFNLEEGTPRLLSPERIRAADPDEIPSADASEEEEKGFWGRDDTLFTGTAASAFLHRVVDARLTYIEQELGASLDDTGASASAEFGRFMGVAARLDLAIDTRQIPIHQRLIRV